MLASNFNMKDLGEAKFVLGKDRSKKSLGLSQRLYIDIITKRFSMENCSGGELPIGKGDKFSSDQCPKNDLERDIMKIKPYASLVGSLMYVQVCTRSDLAFAVSVLRRFQANLGTAHWTATKKVLRYLKKTKDFMLVYSRVDELERWPTQIRILQDVLMIGNPLMDIFFYLLVVQYLGKVPSKSRLQHRPWKLNSLAVTQQPSKQFG
ncbi:hypothetical protein COP2_001190 [Malus domestica]